MLHRPLETTPVLDTYPKLVFPVAIFPLYRRAHDIMYRALYGNSKCQMSSPSAQTALTWCGWESLSKITAFTLVAEQSLQSLSATGLARNTPELIVLDPTPLALVFSWLINGFTEALTLR